MKLNSSIIPMERLNYKIFLDRYAQKDMSKTNILKGVVDTIVVAITDLSDPKYPQKEICKLVEKLSDELYVVQNIFDEVQYTLSIDRLLEPTELYPEAVWHRIAHSMANFEFNYKDTKKLKTDNQLYESWYSLLKDWKFVPAGRILASLGTEFQENLTPYNCFVVRSPKDSRKGAIETLQTMTEMMSRGGGVGINLSTLRPRHAVVKGVNGTSSGAVSWGGGYSYYTGLIEQGGSRRGALLLGLSVWHPDILEFISSKQEAGKIENANISVLVTEDFMQAIEKDEMWTLRFPDTSYENYETEWTGNIKTWEAKGYPVITYKEIPARELWNKIVESAWKSGEPGVIWLERYNNLSNTWYYEEIIATNPCLTGDTLIHTTNGLKRMKELYETQEEFKVIVDSRLGNMQSATASKVFKTGTKQVYKLVTNEGYEVRLTGDHKVLTTNGWKQSKDLSTGDKILVGDTGTHYPTATFKELIEDGTEDVYDMQVPGVNAFIANGLVVHNCGEQGLPPWGVCNLAHVNLAQIRLNINQDFGIDWEDLGKTIRQAVRFLDNIIDMAYYFLPENEKAQKNSRRIGLGTMGLAELMIKLGIRYGSQESLELIDKLFEFIRDIAYETSMELAKERGSFPAFDKMSYVEGKFIETLPVGLQKDIFNNGIRNATLLTQAPTGTVGTMVGTSTGIEPFYQWKYLRKCRLGDDIRYERVAKEYMKDNGLKDINELPSYFVTAMELTPKEHVQVMARIQKYVDSSISKTVNCPADWTVEQVQEIYKLAYDLGCKGITIYRDGSRDSQVLNTIDDKKTSQSGSIPVPNITPDPLRAELPELKWGDKIKVPEDTIYRKVKLNTGCGKIILMLGYSESLERIVDVYTIVNSTGGCQLNIQGLAITISQYLRLGGDIEKLYLKSKEAGNCGSYQYKRGQGHKDLCGKSCFNAILKTIRDLEPKSTVQTLPVIEKTEHIEAIKMECPSCKQLTLIRQSGCYNCPNCGYSKCE